MNGQLHPWTLFIDLKMVLLAAMATLAALVVVLAVLAVRRRRAQEKPQDGG